MHTSIAISVLLGAGAIAHPHFKLANPLAHVHHKRQVPFETHTTTVGNQVLIEDVYVTTIGGPGPSPAPQAPAPAPVVVNNKAAVPDPQPKKLDVAPVRQNNYNVHPKQQHHKQEAPAPVITPAPSTTPVVEPAPAPTSTPTHPSESIGGDDGAPKSGGKSILESANKFRSLMGFPEFTYSSQLDANAAKTNKADGANTMTHQLNAGSMAQCITQMSNTEGTQAHTPFELAYLGWLCEIDDARLGNMCQEMKDATNMFVDKSEPGHAKILRDPKYTKMGCNYMASTSPQPNFKGMYTCDFQ